MARGSKALVTINVNGVLCQNARASFVDAARRWGVDYVEIDEKLAPRDVHPIVVKFLLFEILSDIERIFYIDADAIIRDDTPSPFNCCSADKLGIVEDGVLNHDSVHGLAETIIREHATINRRLNSHLKLTHRYFNAGVMILTRNSHAALLRRGFDIRRLLDDRPYDIKSRDQAIINYLIAEGNLDLHYLPSTWNFLKPHRTGQLTVMDHYVYHFAGMPFREQLISMVGWQASSKQQHPALVEKCKPVFAGFGEWVTWTRPPVSTASPRDDDKYWRAAIEYIYQNISPRLKILSLSKFAENAAGTDVVIVTDVEDLSGIETIVIHKSRVNGFSASVWESILNHYSPVFANEVFVILTTDATADVLGGSPHYRSLLEILSRGVSR